MTVSGGRPRTEQREKVVQPDRTPVAQAPATRQSARSLQRTAGNRAASAFLKAAQPKLVVGNSTDPLEREADSVADRVLAALRTRSTGDTNDSERAKTADGVQDSVATGPAVHRAQRRVQRLATIGAEGGPLDADTESAVARARGGGRPLDSESRTSMETAFGADFADVRVHTGADSADLNRQMQANAFTVGSDIFLGDSSPDTSTAPGQHLLAHELTHVVQQGGAGRQQPVRRSPAPAPAPAPAPVPIEGITTAPHAPVIRREIGKDAAMHSFVTKGPLTYKISAVTPEGDRTKYNLKLVKDGKVTFTIITAYSDEAGFEKAAAPVAAAKVLSPVEQLYAAVTPTDIDVGKKFLKDLRASRPKGVNDAEFVKSNSALSNCALATMGALTSKTASEASVDVQKRLGGRADDTASTPDPAMQKETMWATQLLPASIDPLKAAGIITTIDRGDFEEGKGEIIGNGQFYGMMEYLRSVFQPDTSVSGAAVGGATPSASSVPPTTFSIYRHGMPGPDGDKPAALIDAMKRYPSGTRFAAFLYSSDVTQHVRAHWVYAEQFGGQIIFSDYQKNNKKLSSKGATVNEDPVADFVDKFPISPHKNDVDKKGFESGSFIALVPAFGGVAPTGIPDTEMTASAIGEALGEARSRLQTLQETHGLEGPASGSIPSTMLPATTTDQIRIPSPALVKREVEAFITSVGLTPHTTMNADPKLWQIDIVGHPSIDFSEGQANIRMKAMNATVTSHDATGAETGEKGLTKGEFPYSKDLKTGLDFLGSTAASAGDGSIFVNPNLFCFPDLIHEAFHTYTDSGGEQFFNEGCTEIFAGIVSEKIKAVADNVDYAYVFNTDYTRFVTRMHQLADIIGIAGLAAAYFDKAGPRTSLTKQLIQKRKMDEPEAARIAGQLTAKEAFPALFDTAILELQGQGPTTPEASSPELATDFGREKTAFAAKMEEQRASMLGDLPGGVAATGTMSEADRNKIADAASMKEKIAVTIRLIEQYYPVLKQTKGAPYVTMMAYIDGCERYLAELQHRTYEEVHEEYAAPVVTTFRFLDPEKTIGADDTVHVLGDIDELGGGVERNAVPMRRDSGGFISAPIELVACRAMKVQLRFIVRHAGAARDLVAGPVKMPSATTATVSATASGITAA